MNFPGPIFWIWTASIISSGIFAAWYFNWRGALSAAEVDRYVEKLHANTSMSAEQKEIIGAFLSNDDGGEFVMLNVIKFHDTKQPHPKTGEPTAPMKLLTEYQRQFLGQLFRRAGHPLYVARKKGGYIDTFGRIEMPEYSFVSMVRYRSRRDLADAIVNTAFPEAHAYKMAAIEHTFNFPTQMTRIGVWGPGRIVPVLLALIAAFLHIAIVTIRG